MPAPRISKSLYIPILLAAALALTGCASESTVGLILQPDGRARFVVTGANPLVEVDNAGPGRVTVTFTPRSTSAPDQLDVLHGTVGQTLRGGGEVMISNSSPDRAKVHVSVRGHDGLEVTQPSAPSALQ